MCSLTILQSLWLSAPHLQLGRLCMLTSTEDTTAPTPTGCCTAGQTSRSTNRFVSPILSAGLSPTLSWLRRLRSPPQEAVWDFDGFRFQAAEMTNGTVERTAEGDLFHSFLSVLYFVPASSVTLRASYVTVGNVWLKDQVLTLEYFWAWSDWTKSLWESYREV